MFPHRPVRCQLHCEAWAATEGGRGSHFVWCCTEGLPAPPGHGLEARQAGGKWTQHEAT